MSKKLGCSTPVLIILLVLFIGLLIFSFVIGPLGVKLFGFHPPEFLSLEKPAIELPSGAIAHISGFTVTNTLIASWITIIVLTILFFLATRKLNLIPGRVQNFVEFIIDTLLNFINGSAGEKNARRLFPLIATIFFYVVTNAYLALLPFYGESIYIVEPNGAHVPLLRAANTDINLPLSIAVISFIFIEVLGFRSQGFFRYVNSFFKFGQLRDGVVSLFKGKLKPAFSGIAFGFINLFIGVLEIISHFIRLLSFTFRLFGNMTAGEILLVLVTFLVPLIAALPFYGLELLVGFLQAMIFAGLTMVFATMALTSHDEEH